MPTYYIDPANGNDSSSGTSWGTAWRTITSGATAARTAPGDEIRIAETPAISAGVNATFTNTNRAIVLASALTKTINHADGTTGWTAATNITLSGGSNRKYGDNALQVTPASAFTTGKVCHALVAGGGTQDFSGYTKISFWMRPPATTAIAANTYKLCLCSDANGNTIVNQINIPATLNNTGWHIMVLDNVTALGSSIQSVAIYANSDPGTISLAINNIVACNDVTHETLIGWQDDCFYNVQSFDGTTINIDSVNTSPASGKGWYGTTGTATLYYIKPFTNLSTGVYNNINEAGASGNPIKYIGGWNIASNTRTGRTAFASNLVGSGTGIGLSTRSFTEYSYFILARFNNPISIATSIRIVLDNIVFCGSQTLALRGFVSNCKALNLSNIITLTNYAYYNCTFASNPNYGASIQGNPKLINCVFGNNSSTSIAVSESIDGTDYPGSGPSLYKCLLEDYGEVEAADNNLGFIIWSYDHDQTLGNHWGFTYQATVNWQTTVKRTGDPGSWRVVHSGADRTQSFPVRFQFAQIAVSASAQVTVKAWVKKDHATNVGCRIFVEDADFTLAGITAQSATAANNTNWQEITIQFTPTVDGIVPIWFDSWYISANSNTYIGSITVTQ